MPRAACSRAAALRAHRGAVISPVSCTSYAPAIGSAAMALSNQNTNMYTRMQAAGVMSTRIYTTVGASGGAGCLTASCTYGGAVKALNLAAQYGMTGARRTSGRVCAAP